MDVYYIIVTLIALVLTLMYASVQNSKKASALEEEVAFLRRISAFDHKQYTRIKKEVKNKKRIINKLQTELQFNASEVEHLEKNIERFRRDLLEELLDDDDLDFTVYLSNDMSFDKSDFATELFEPLAEDKVFIGVGYFEYEAIKGIDIRLSKNKKTMYRKEENKA